MYLRHNCGGCGVDAELVAHTHVHQFVRQPHSKCDKSDGFVVRQEHTAQNGDVTPPPGECILGVYAAHFASISVLLQVRPAKYYKWIIDVAPVCVHVTRTTPATATVSTKSTLVRTPVTKLNSSALQGNIHSRKVCKVVTTSAQRNMNGNSLECKVSDWLSVGVIFSPVKSWQRKCNHYNKLYKIAFVYTCVY